MVDDDSIGRGYSSVSMVDSSAIPEGHDLYPSRENIVSVYDYFAAIPEHPTPLFQIREATNLVADAKSGDKFLFHFSGHSRQIQQSPDAKHKERDGRDEGEHLSY